jgi:hypothetical protein
VGEFYRDGSTEQLVMRYNNVMPKALSCVTAINLFLTYYNVDILSLGIWLSLWDKYMNVHPLLRPPGKVMYEGQWRIGSLRE